MNAKMWYSGSAVSMTSLPEAQKRPPHLEPCMVFATQIAVREHRALRDAGRAAGVLQAPRCCRD